MPMAFPVLNRAMGVAVKTEPPPSWGAVMGELWPIISSPLTLAGERLLLDVIHHKGRLSVAETDELPHSLSPDEMLKSLAVQALARWTSLTYITELRRLEVTAASPALQDVIRAVIRTAQTARPETVDADAISEEEPEIDEADERPKCFVSTFPISEPELVPGRRWRIVRPVRQMGNLTYISGERVRRGCRKKEFELVGIPGWG